VPTPTFSSASYQLNPKSPNDNQDSPAVAALDDGRFAAVYRSGDADPGAMRLVIYNADGTIATKQTIVDPGNVDAVNSNMTDVAALKGGGFVVTWVQWAGSNEEVYHRVYGADGKPVSDAILTSSDEVGSISRRPDAVSDGKGGFYITWDDASYDTDPGPGTTATRSVRLQHFDANGQPTAASERLSDTMGGDWSPTIAVNRDGTQVNVVWDDDIGQTGNDTDGIYGTVDGGATYYRVDSGAYSEFHTAPDVAYSTGNNFMTVWNENVTAADYAVYGSINGGPEFQINTTSHTLSTTLQKVVGLRDGNFMVVWSDGGHGGNDDVLGQLISGTGEKIGQEFTISDRVSSEIGRISAAETIDGRVIVTWSSSDGPMEVYGRMVDPRQGALDWTGDESAESIVATTFADTLDGGAGNDVIQGGDGADAIEGGEGGDTLSGNAGADTLGGGSGADIFLFSRISDSMDKAFDTITDFARGEDDINLRRIDANEDARGNQAFDFIGKEHFHKEAGELRFDVTGGSATIAGDTDGDGKADFLLVLEDVGKIKASDFIL